jgi:hypothetical protein
MRYNDRILMSCLVFSTVKVTMIVPNCVRSEALQMTTINMVVFEETTSCKVANT